MLKKKFIVRGVLVGAALPMSSSLAAVSTVTTNPILVDTFIDSSATPHVVGGIDQSSYGMDAKVKAVSSATNNNFTGQIISYTHVLLQIPTAVFTAYAAGSVSDVTINYYPVNDSLSNPSSPFYDGDGVLQLHPLTKGFTDGNGAQSFGPAKVQVYSTTGGATWATTDGNTDGTPSDTWSTPGGDYDAAYVNDNNSTLPASNGPVPFTWDITSLLANSTTRTELENYGALIRLPNEPVSQFQLDNATQDFASLDSANAASNRPFYSITSVPEPTSLAFGMVASGAMLLPRRRRKDSND